LLSKTIHDFENFCFGADVDPAGGLVHQQHLRICKQALSHHNFLLIPATERSDRLLGISLLYEQDRFAEAETALKRFVMISAKPAPAYAFLALCEYETHDYDRALQHFQSWAQKDSPGTSNLIDVAGFHWALLLTRQGRFPEALYLLAAKAKKLGDSPALTEAMGLASLRMLNLPEDYPPERRESVWLAGKAAFYGAIEEFPRAQEYADKLLLHYAREPNVHYFRGTLFSFRGENAAAIQEYQQELQ
jgi:tetratricopeptide (TPR) repeat protein